MPVNRAGFGFIAGFGPAAGADLEITRGLDQPIELVGVAAHDHQRVADIDRMISAEPEFTAGLQFGGKQIDRAIIHHPPLGMPRLGPRIGMEEIEKTERTIGDPPQHFQRIAMVDPDIAQGSVRAVVSINMGQRLCDPVEERFGPDEAMVRQHISARGHMSIGKRPLTWMPGRRSAV